MQGDTFLLGQPLRLLERHISNAGARGSVPVGLTISLLAIRKKRAARNWNTCAIGKLDTFGRPLGGGEVVAIPMAHWELDDPLPRFATGAFNLERWWEASAKPTHRIFVDTKQFDRWLASLQPLGPLTNRQVEAIVDPQKRAVRAVAREATVKASSQASFDEARSQLSPDPPGVGPVLMTLDEVCDLTRRSSSTIYTNMEKGIFPEPIKLGSSSRWLKTEVLAYIAEQAAKRGGS